MKKILLIVAALLLLIAIPVTIFLVKQNQDVRQRATAATSIYIDPSEITKNVDETFTADVKMDTSINYVAAARIDISVNPLYLEIISIQPGNLLPEVQSNPSINNGNVTVIFSVSHTPGQPTNGAHGIGTAATLRLRALTPTQQGTPTEIRILPTSVGSGTIQEDPSTYQDGIDIIQNRSHGKVVILSAGGTSATPAPSASPGNSSPGPSPSSSPSSQKVTKITSPANAATVTTARPVISGVSFNNGLIILSISSNLTAVLTPPAFYATSQGSWTYTPNQDLTDRNYTISVSATDSTTSAQETATSTFTVAAAGTGGTNTASPSPVVSSTPASSATNSGVPVTGSTMPTFLLLGAGAMLLLFGAGAVFFP